MEKNRCSRHKILRGGIELRKSNLLHIRFGIIKTPHIELLPIKGLDQHDLKLN